jgi:hypothetical protein
MIQTSKFIAKAVVIMGMSVNGELVPRVAMIVDDKTRGSFADGIIVNTGLPRFLERIPTQSGSSFANVDYSQPALALDGGGQVSLQLHGPAIGAEQPQQRPALGDGGEAGSSSQTVAGEDFMMTWAGYDDDYSWYFRDQSNNVTGSDASEY